MARLASRAERVGLEIHDELASKLAAYYLGLASWNARVNFTALALDSDGTDASVDRLLMEPLAAANHVSRHATSLLDVGSGGGSPAIPLKLARPDLTLHMVESKTRKSVFLRQMARSLGLEETYVHNFRYETLIDRPQFIESLSVVSVRAVRIDPLTIATLSRLLVPRGELFCFVAGEDPGPDPLAPMRRAAVHNLVQDNGSSVVVYQKQSA